MEYLSVDIGGSQIKSGIVCAGGEIRCRKSVQTPHSADPDELMQVLCSIVSGLWTEDIGGIGISTLGAVDAKRGMVVGACDNLQAICNLSVKQVLEQTYAVPVSMCNDVNAAALGEAFYGAGRGLEQFYCLTLGTGVGGAYVCNGQVLCGANGLAGEIGYLHRGDACGYEERASVSAFLKMCRESGDIRSDGTEVFTSAIEGRENRSVFRKWIDNIAEGICDLIYLFDPGTVIIGGGVSSHGKKLCDPIEAAVNARLQPDFAGKTRILAAAAGNNANLLGAVVPFTVRR